MSSEVSGCKLAVALPEADNAPASIQARIAATCSLDNGGPPIGISSV